MSGKVKADAAKKDAGFYGKADKLVKDIKGQAGNLLSKIFMGPNIMAAVIIGIAYLILSIIGLGLLGVKAGKIIIGFPAVFIIAWVGQLIAGNYTILNSLGIEYVLRCLFIGLFISNVSDCRLGSSPQ